MEYKNEYNKIKASDLDEQKTSSPDNFPYGKILACASVLLLVSGAFYAEKYKDALHQGFFFEKGREAGMLWTILALATIALAVGIHSWVNSDKKKPAAQQTTGITNPCIAVSSK